MSKSGSDTPVVITPGEPAGIGPDLVIDLVARGESGLVICASKALMQTRASQLGKSIACNDYLGNGVIRPGELNMIDVPVAAEVIPGTLNPANSRYVLQTLETAVSLCESGTCSAMVTGPVNKAVINDAGIPFSGHTEWLAERTGTEQVVMMLATTDLRVALVTTHMPLRDVADAIKPELLRRVLEIVHTELADRFGISAPRMIVLGLNPHAGEAGHLGREEIEVITPVLRSLPQEWNITGPMPADTAFTPAHLANADVVIAMYHDQGLPVLKHHGFGNAANITLGLPIVRTSVDHGTALDLAGSGTADPGSLLTAIRIARRMATTL